MAKKVILDSNNEEVNELLEILTGKGSVKEVLPEFPADHQFHVPVNGESKKGTVEELDRWINKCIEDVNKKV